MKQFFGAFFGSCLGILITGVVITLIVIASVASMFSDAVNMKKDKGYTAKENTVLKINLDGDIKERSIKNPFGDVDLGPFMPKGTVGIGDIIESLKFAKTDKNIKGIYFRINLLPSHKIRSF